MVARRKKAALFLCNQLGECEVESRESLANDCRKKRGGGECLFKRFLLPDGRRALVGGKLMRNSLDFLPHLALAVRTQCNSEKSDVGTSVFCGSILIEYFHLRMHIIALYLIHIL